MSSTGSVKWWNVEHPFTCGCKDVGVQSYAQDFQVWGMFSCNFLLYYIYLSIIFPLNDVIS